MSSTEGSLTFALFATGVTAIGGFLFGYDTAVINGANTYLKGHFALQGHDPGTQQLDHVRQFGPVLETAHAHVVEGLGRGRIR